MQIWSYLAKSKKDIAVYIFDNCEHGRRHVEYIKLDM